MSRNPCVCPTLSINPEQCAGCGYGYLTVIEERKLRANEVCRLWSCRSKTMGKIPASSLVSNARGADIQNEHPRPSLRTQPPRTGNLAGTITPMNLFYGRGPCQDSGCDIAFKLAQIKAQLRDSRRRQLVSRLIVGFEGR